MIKAIPRYQTIEVDPAICFVQLGGLPDAGVQAWLPGLTRDTKSPGVQLSCYWDHHAAAAIAAAAPYRGLTRPIGGSRF